jgi:hypothetical protein
MESAIKMARLALNESGVSEEAIKRAEDMYRARDKERLKIQIEAATCAPRATASSPSRMAHRLPVNASTLA